MKKISVFCILYSVLFCACTKQQQGVMFGHQDDPFYGIGWEYEPGRSDVLESCGDWPAVM